MNNLFRRALPASEKLLCCEKPIKRLNKEGKMMKDWNYLPMFKNYLFTNSRPSVPQDKYQSNDISPEEALRLALERSFGDDEE